MENVLIVHAVSEPESLNGALLAAALKTFEDLRKCVEVPDLYGVRSRPTFQTAVTPCSSTRPPGRSTP